MLATVVLTGTGTTDSLSSAIRKEAQCKYGQFLSQALSKHLKKEDTFTMYSNIFKIIGFLLHWEILFLYLF